MPATSPARSCTSREADIAEESLPHAPARSRQPSPIDESTVYLDDIELGEVFTTVGRTVTETDVVQFAALSADYNSLHVDAEFAAKSPFGQRIAHGLLVLAITSGLTTRLQVIMRMTQAIRALVNLECRWLKPAFIGDTIHVRVTVESKDDTSKPNEGLMVLRRDAINQRGETIMESRWKILARKRPHV